jgi:uncharacterized protein (TIGR03032 family)
VSVWAQESAALDALWQRHHAAWRDPAQVIAHWEAASAIEPGLLAHRVRGGWWDALEQVGGTLLITREYEHVLLALGCEDGRPHVSYLALPHPSGIAIDRTRRTVFVACTRNPNQICELAPAIGVLDRRGAGPPSSRERPLVPVRTRFVPGCLYLHDLAIIDGQLHATSVGQNAIVRFDEAGRAEPVWWPKAIERGARRTPDFDRNYLQLNSIAAGSTLADSYFSASAERISARRPGHRHFPVDRRGVIFSGRSREPMARGLTRPHSARRHRGKVWVDNSGYGEVGYVVDGRFEAVMKLPGWTRGLCVHGDVGFVGTSRVIPRFRQYAPGLDLDRSVCGVHAVDMKSGGVLGSLIWPTGNQIFAIEWMPRTLGTRLPFSPSRRGLRDARRLFYAFRT